MGTCWGTHGVKQHTYAPDESTTSDMGKSTSFPSSPSPKANSTQAQPVIAEDDGAKQRALPIEAALPVEQAELKKAAEQAESKKAKKAFAAGGGRYSIVSEEALQKLSNTGDTLASIEARVEEVHALLQSPEGGELSCEKLGTLKTELSLLESQAKQLESTGVDSVYTGELNSGKALAKETKKQQLNRLDTLFEKFDGVFCVLKEMIQQVKQKPNEME
eukprot:gnl/MRDRNA2_/MRDRNA2_89558_c0_seq1.p1 gnl/MRDRNA2_/MRDRNA2_89558_c0~~gnl/MRDRNA2_/MRDRNA2_89558_c0_seq1.p1  ORF type:complete len:218 (+),score=56.50 gnl/MRDRNA2_/MRDRNA2_89558_c0_seq1:63-716(+)